MGAWRMALLGQGTAALGQTAADCDPAEDNANAEDNCKQLNAAPAYFNGGLQVMVKAGQFHYMSTRNHAFSNRAQKGTITVLPTTADTPDDALPPADALRYKYAWELDRTSAETRSSPRVAHEVEVEAQALETGGTGGSGPGSGSGSGGGLGGGGSAAAPA